MGSHLQCNQNSYMYMIITNRKNVNYPDLYLHGQVLTKVTTHTHLGMIFSSDMKSLLDISDIPTVNTLYHH